MTDETRKAIAIYESSRWLFEKHQMGALAITDLHLAHELVGHVAKTKFLGTAAPHYSDLAAVRIVLESIPADDVEEIYASELSRATDFVVSEWEQITKLADSLLRTRRIDLATLTAISS